MLVLVAFLIMGLLVLAPSVMVWLSAKNPSPKRPIWRSHTLALLAPLAAGYCLLALIWLLQFEGNCGGWNGETAPCGFGQFATELSIMAAMTLAMPGMVGIGLGLCVLAFLHLRRRTRQH